VNGDQNIEIRTLIESRYVSSLKPCKLQILYIEDDGGRYSDLAFFSEVCPQLVVGRKLFRRLRTL
jgi:hypothetical protein